MIYIQKYLSKSDFDMIDGWKVIKKFCYMCNYKKKYEFI